jgi:hypothetical protein
MKPIKEASYGVARRNNNNRRKFVLVQKRLAKHLPVSPCTALEHMARLSGQIGPHGDGSDCLVIGFAETATALAAAVACGIGSMTSLITTTRELEKPRNEYVLFAEEHSHAIEQFLHGAYLDRLNNRITDIIIVDDEITTGKTARNLINLLREQFKGLSTAAYTVASLLNGIDEVNEKIFFDHDIGMKYLEKVEQIGSLDIDDAILEKTPRSFINATSDGFEILEANGKLDPRFGVCAANYHSACMSLATFARKQLEDELRSSSRILVLGTEECMYPALCLGSLLENLLPKANVLCHSTTRSPIIASKTADYPIRNASLLNSFYDEERTTYLYNLNEYDLVIIITDSENEAALIRSENSLASALSAFGCSCIRYIKWVR